MFDFLNGVSHGLEYVLRESFFIGARAGRALNSLFRCGAGFSDAARPSGQGAAPGRNQHH